MNARRAVSGSHRHVLDPPALCQVIFRLLAAAAARLRVRNPSCLTQAELAPDVAPAMPRRGRNPARSGIYEGTNQIQRVVIARQLLKG